MPIRPLSCSTKICVSGQPKLVLFKRKTRNRRPSSLTAFTNDNRLVMYVTENEKDSETLSEELFGQPIFSYTTEEAVEDGVLVPVGSVGPHKVYFTSNLFSEGYDNLQRRTDAVNRGLALLREPDREDTQYMKLRVIEKDKMWVIAESGKLTYMKPEDY